METKRNAQAYRKEVLKTIIKPDFLTNEMAFSIEEVSWRYTFNILNFFLEGVTPRILSDAKIKYICGFVTSEIEELSKSVDSKQLLMCWLHIGELIEDWIVLAEESEEYESASNLMKILEKSCND